MAENLNFKGNKFCLNHLTEKVKFVCEDCKQKICNTCVSTTHKGHNLIGIKLLAQQKYEKLQDLNTDIQKNKIPRVRSKLQAAEQSVNKIKQGINTNINTAVTQGEHLKELIDISTAETVSELEAVKAKITQQLDQFEADSEAVIKRLEDLMKESTEATKSDNNILIVDVEEQISTQTIIEPEFVCDFASMEFVKGPDPETNIRTALGTIVCGQLPPVVQSKKPTEPFIFDSLELPISPQSIQRTQQGTLWICEYNTKLLTKINTDGSKKTLTLDTCIKDICVDPVTDQIYCAPFDDKSIRTLDTQSGKTAKLFTTSSVPHCLNVTNSGNIFIVGINLECQVTLYDKRGSILQTLTIVASPYHIAVCRSTGRVAIACWKRGVMVMEYKADRLHPMITYPTIGTVTAVEFDDAGQVLVADSKNKTVQNIATGKTFKKINLDGTPTCLLAQNSNGDILLGTRYPNKLLTIKSCI